MSKLILKLFLTILLLSVFNNFAMAENRNAAKVFVQFLQGKGEHASDPLMTELRQEDSLPAGEYRAKAKVTLATEGVLEVFDSRALDWQIPPQRAEESASGWLKRGGEWIWTPSPVSTHALLDLPFVAARDTGDHGISLFGFDELWLDFAESVPGKPCHISVGMNVTAEGEEAGGRKSDIRQLRLVSGPGETLSPMLSVDSANAIWKPRDNFYLAKRILGLEFDEDWRYVQDKKNTVIQRRFHQDLQNVEALDFFFEPGIAVERINVVLSWKNLLSHDEVVEWGDIPKHIESIPTGTRVRLHLGAVLRARSVDQKRESDAFLKEVVVFIRGQAERLIPQHPLHTMVFQSMPAASRVGGSGDIVYLTQRSEPLALGNRRLVVDLRQFVSKAWREVIFKNGIVTLQSNNPMQYCGVRPISLRLVTLGEGRRSVLVGDILRFSQTLGGPFLMPSKTSSVIEWIETDSYLPFALLPVQPQKIKLDDHELQLAGWNVALRVSSADKARIEKESNGVILAGVGGEVKLLWTRPVKLDRESRLIFKVLQGAEQILDASAEIDLDSGEKALLGLVVNQPVMLGSPKRAGKTIQRIAIRLKMRGVPFVLKLDELALFHPRLVRPNAVISTPRPDFEFAPLTAMDAKAPEHTLLTTDDSRVYGVLPAGNHQTKTLLWSTPVHQPAGTLVALQFDYRLSAAADEPCWLTVTLNAKGRSLTRQLCPKGEQGKLVEPLAQFLGDIPPNEMVRTISWKAQLPVGRHQEVSFDFQAHLGTVRAPSVADLLQNHPPFRIRQQPYRQAVLTGKALKDLRQQGSAWLDLGTFSLEGERLPFQLDDSHRYFHITRVNLDSSTVPTEEQWARLLAKDKHNRFSWAERLVVFGALLVVAGWIWLRRHSLPWLVLVERWVKTCNRVTWVCVFLALVLYFLGLRYGNSTNDNYFFIFGSLVSVLAWHTWLTSIRTRIEVRWPAAAEKIYGGAGTLYFTGAVAGLVLTALLMITKLEFLAQQVAVVVYYFLVAGTALEILALRRQSRKQAGEAGKTTAKDTAG